LAKRANFRKKLVLNCSKRLAGIDGYLITRLTLASNQQKMHHCGYKESDLETDRLSGTKLANG
jgi:hypothetical protein